MKIFFGKVAQDTVTKNYSREENQENFELLKTFTFENEK